jgi:hypothetical protein
MKFIHSRVSRLYMYMCWVFCYTSDSSLARSQSACGPSPPAPHSEPRASADFINDPTEHGEHTNTDVLQYYGATAINNICCICECVKKTCDTLLLLKCLVLLVETPTPPHKMLSGFCDVDRSRTGGGD